MKVNLRKTTAAIQRLENKAAEKCGIRFALMCGGKQLMAGDMKFVNSQIEQMAADLLPEIQSAVKEGKSMVRGIMALKK